MTGGFVDWNLARATARRLTPAGPRIDVAEAARAVESLRRAAEQAHEPVAETSRLQAPPGQAPAMIVDRGTWSEINISTFSALMDPVVDRLVDRKDGRAMLPAVRRVGGVASGAEVGTLLSFLSTKVLGQYDIAPGRSADEARLVLVAPNIVQAEQEMRVDPEDFRLWVALHEETHRVQFTANPWLREHLVSRFHAVLTELVPDAASLEQRLTSLVAGLPEAARSDGLGMMSLVITPEQRAALDEITAIMSLLEGHADVVMDQVGPRVVPSVDTIRARFEKRRDGMGPVDVLLRRLLGLEVKMRQYREGAAFVRAVTDQVGVDGFNTVWTSAETLPTPAEIADPARWIARVRP